MEYKYNIRIKEALRYTSETDRELFALAVKIKCAYSSSVLFQPSINSIQTLCHCSRQKAVKLNRLIRERNDLFRYDGKRVVVRSLISKKIKYTETKKGDKKKYTSDFVLKVKRQDILDMKFKDVVTMIRRSLLEFKMNFGKDKEDYFLKDGKNKTLYSADIHSQSYYANMLSVSTSTIHRDINRMVKEGKFVKHPAVVSVVGVATSESIEEYIRVYHTQPVVYKRKGLFLAVTSCRYDRCDRPSFLHKINGYNIPKKEGYGNCVYDGKQEYALPSTQSHFDN